MNAIETLLWSKKWKLRNANASGSINADVPRGWFEGVGCKVLRLALACGCAKGRINADVPRGWFEGVGCKVLRLALACGCAKGRIYADVHVFTIFVFVSLRVAISVVLCKLSFCRNLK
jgi:hypothetical protein